MSRLWKNFVAHVECGCLSLIALSCVAHDGKRHGSSASGALVLHLLTSVTEVFHPYAENDRVAFVSRSVSITPGQTLDVHDLSCHYVCVCVYREGGTIKPAPGNLGYPTL